jgi:hypothetical protein
MVATWSKCSEAFRRNKIALSTFEGWVPQAVTRFSLVSRLENSFAALQIDADSSSIQYPTASLLLSTFAPSAIEWIQTISMDDIVVVKALTTENVKLVVHGDSHYVLKTIERQDEIQQWQSELTTLSSLNILRIVSTSLPS